MAVRTFEQLKLIIFENHCPHLSTETDKGKIIKVPISVTDNIRARFLLDEFFELFLHKPVG